MVVCKEASNKQTCVWIRFINKCIICCAIKIKNKTFDCTKDSHYFSTTCDLLDWMPILNYGGYKILILIQLLISPILYPYLHIVENSIFFWWWVENVQTQTTLSVLQFNVWPAFLPKHLHVSIILVIL